MGLKSLVPLALKKPVRVALNKFHTYRYIKAHPDTMVPPQSMSFVGGGDCLTIGREFLEHFIEIGLLKPHHHVLDVGCGFGRMAIPLTGYLHASGSYEGFDVVPVGIKWCQERITPRFPSFRFELADIHNTHYNPKGRQRASDYVFPYRDGKFDFVCLTSVFTHLLPAALIRYLSEIHRVLAPGGRVLATFFLLNNESEQGIVMGKSALTLKHFGAYEDISYRIESASNPEETVAYPEAAIRKRFEEAGLCPVHAILYGHWSGREGGASFQDIVVLGRCSDHMGKLSPESHSASG